MVDLQIVRNDEDPVTTDVPPTDPVSTKITPAEAYQRLESVRTEYTALAVPAFPPDLLILADRIYKILEDVTPDDGTLIEEVARCRVSMMIVFGEILKSAAITVLNKRLEDEKTLRGFRRIKTS